MRIDNRSVGFAGILDWVCAHPRWWFAFIEKLMLTGLLEYLAWHYRSWVFLGLWAVSVVFLVAPIVRGVIEGVRAAIETLPWAQIEGLPRVITYPAVVVLGLTVPMVMLVMVDYTMSQIARVIGVIAKSHMTPY